MKTSKTLKTAALSIPWNKPYFSGKEKDNLADAFESTWISGGKYVDAFESRFSKTIKAPFGITTSNGTTALQLALMALGIGAKDEVIVPAFTFVAPVNMVLEAGATPVYGDIDPRTWCLDPKSVEKLITKKTKAICPVHLYGNVCDMDPLIELARKNDLWIVEDAAESALSKYKGKYSGTFGDIGCFSFQATKTLTMGEGGFVATKDEALYKKMRLIRDHGMRKEKRYWHDAIGYNFRLTNLQAAVGCAQLDNIVDITAQRKRVYETYCRLLAQEEGITLQTITKDVEPVMWAMALKIDPKFFKGDRDFLMNALAQAGIETRPGFYTFADMPLYEAKPLVHAQKVSRNLLVLPFFPSLTEDEIAYICEQLKELKK